MKDAVRKSRHEARKKAWRSIVRWGGNSPDEEISSILKADLYDILDEFAGEIRRAESEAVE